MCPPRRRASVRFGPREDHLALEKISEIHGEHVDHPDASPFRDHRRERLLMGIVPVCRQQNELLEPARFPRVEQVIEHPVQRLFSDRAVAREYAFRGGVDAVFDRWRPNDGELGGQVVGEAFDDDRVAAHRQVRAMLLTGADWNDQPRVRRLSGGDLRRDHLLEETRPRSGQRRGSGHSHAI